MNSYNYQTKIEHRKNLFLNLDKNKTNPDNLTITDWYKQNMPFLPKEVFEVIENINKENNENNKI